MRLLELICALPYKYAKQIVAAMDEGLTLDEALQAVLDALRVFSPEEYEKIKAQFGGVK